ncbi:hypothetical protein ABB02_00300 [Clostridiaceae bacterium JG1575]|nr:hypothetical protein ABB02_00300 [Clostridiaceae bacterium JG1575]
MKRILIVEDDAYLREELMLTLCHAGYEATALASFDQAASAILSSPADLLLLDLALPQISGFDLCRSIKARSRLPILVLTARDGLSDELLALSLGADDYLTKPCPSKRLLARIRKLLQTYEKMGDLRQVGELILERTTGKLLWQEQQMVLPDTECHLLWMLLEASPRLVPRNELYQGLWGDQIAYDENILQVNLTRLRKKLKDLGLSQALVNVRGEGYRLEVPQS